MRSFSFPSLLLLSSNCSSINDLSFTSSLSSHNINTETSPSLVRQNQLTEMDKFDDLQDPSTNFPEHDPDTISDIFASEVDHMPSQNFFSRLEDTDFYRTFRLEAISLFLQAQYSFNHDPFVTYLAMNYLDRFMSKHNLPQGKPWVTRLVQISCLSLATKMKNTPISSSDFQRGEGFVLEAQMVHKMELVILDTLQWRMRSITPFSFLHFFLSLLVLNDRSFSQAIKHRASCVIFNANNEIKIVEFKPSIIGASAVLAACHELLPLQFASFQASISSCQYVNKECLFKCFNLVQEMIVKERYESMSCARTPISVLDPRFTKSESDYSISTTASAATPGTCSTSMIAERRDSKRRRLNARLCSENRLEV